MHAYIIINNDEQTVMTHSISYLISSLKIMHTTPPQEIFIENKTPAMSHLDSLIFFLRAEIIEILVISEAATTTIFHLN